MSIVETENGQYGKVIGEDGEHAEVMLFGGQVTTYLRESLREAPKRVWPRILLAAAVIEMERGQNDR